MINTRLEAVVVGLLLLLTVPMAAQRQPHTIFKDAVGLSDKEIGQIDSGQVVTKVIETEDKYGLLVFGATYVNAPVEKFAAVLRDVEKLEQEKVYLVVGRFAKTPGQPVTAADFERLNFDEDDIDDIEDCEIEDCAIQFANQATMEKLRDIAKQDGDQKYTRFNQTFHALAAETANHYMKGGLKALGSYHDRENPLDLYEQTKDMADSSHYLPRAKAPEIHDHIVEYPQSKMTGAEDIFEFEKIDFGQGPTIRINHISLFPEGAANVKLVASNKQLYASKYMRVALQMYYCIPDSSNPSRPGFYLIEMSDSRLPDFGGFKLGIVKRVARGKAVEGTHDTLATYKRLSEAP